MKYKSKSKIKLVKDLILIAMLSAVGTFSVVSSSLSLPSYAAPFNNNQVEEDHIDADRASSNKMLQEAFRLYNESVKRQMDAERANINAEKISLRALRRNLRTAIDIVDNIIYHEAAKQRDSGGVNHEKLAYRSQRLRRHAVELLSSNSRRYGIESTNPDFEDDFDEEMGYFTEEAEYCVTVLDDDEDENSLKYDPLNDFAARVIASINQRQANLNARIREVNARQVNLNALMAEQEQILRDMNAM